MHATCTGVTCIGLLEPVWCVHRGRPAQMIVTCTGVTCIGFLEPVWCVHTGECRLHTAAGHEQTGVAVGPGGDSGVGGPGHHVPRLWPGPLQHHWRLLQPRPCQDEEHGADLVHCVCCSGRVCSRLCHCAAVRADPHGAEAD